MCTISPRHDSASRFDYVVLYPSSSLLQLTQCTSNRPILPFLCGYQALYLLRTHVFLKSSSLSFHLIPHCSLEPSSYQKSSSFFFRHLKLPCSRDACAIHPKAQSEYALRLSCNASPTHPPPPKDSKRIWKFPSVNMLFFPELSVCDSLLPVHHRCPSSMLFSSNPFSLQLFLCYQQISCYLIIKNKSKGQQDDYISRDVYVCYLAI